jgi:(p)ppGpp synthase/HD superfamily hydrolase
MSQLIKRAAIFAKRARGAQVRKYTGEPYWNHPMAVAATVAKVMPSNEHAIAAAWLHDVLEDTAVTASLMRAAFGARVTDLVLEVTDVSRPGDGNRARRTEIDRHHLFSASREGKTIKLADLMDNTASITAHDPDFAIEYLREKRLTMPMLIGGHEHLWRRVMRQLDTLDRRAA